MTLIWQWVSLAGHPAELAEHSLFFSPRWRIHQLSLSVPVFYRGGITWYGRDRWSSQDTSLIKNILLSYAKSDRNFKRWQSAWRLFLPTNSLLVIETFPASAVEQRRIRGSPGHDGQHAPRSTWTSEASCSPCLAQQHAFLHPPFSFLVSLGIWRAMTVVCNQTLKRPGLLCSC